MVTRARSPILGPEFDAFVDDDEETLSGSSFHQDAFVGAYDSLRNYSERQELPWFVGNQLKMIVPWQGSRPTAAPTPDLLVHPTLGPEGRQSLHLPDDGPPALVIEILSPATARSRDLNTVAPEGKPQLYAACGIPEYLAFDPLGDYVPDQIRAWRMGPGGVYIPWESDEQGYWVSDALGIAFAPGGRWLNVYDGQRRRVPSNRDVNRLVAEAAALREERERIAQENAALREELRRLRGE